MMNIVLSENKFKQGQIYEAKKKTRDILDNGHFDDGGDFFIFCEDGRCVRADEYGSYQWISKLVGISPAEAGGFGNSLYDMLSVMDHYVRKTAHFLEYALLGVLVCRALGIDVKKKAHLLGAALAFCSFYAVTDELHQYFVPGRSCQIKDVMIDSSGALTGICFCMLAGFVLKKIKNKRRNVRQKNTPDVRVF